MALTIHFYKFNKKPNSTKLPDLQVETHYGCQGVLLDATSVTNPVITVQQVSGVNIREYNYVHIPSFNRYYFVSNITTSKNLWIVALSVDVLATYRADILASSQYVVRSSSQSDENYVDKMYLTKPFTVQSGNRSRVNFYDSGYVSRQLSDAIGQVFYFNYEGRVPSNAVCFGIVGKNGVGANYYVATETNFINFMTNVFALVPSDLGNMADGLKKLLLDLNQYILSVVRLPVMPHTDNLGIHLTTVDLGSYTLNCDCYSITPGLHKETYFLTDGITLPQHPNISTHAYYGLPPFTSYTLDMLPLGSVPLDTAKLYGMTDITVEWTLDYISGLAYFRVGKGTGTANAVNPVLFTDIAQVGVPIPLSQLKVDNQTGFGLSVANAMVNSGEAKVPEEGGIKSYNAGGYKVSFPLNDFGEQLGRAIRSTLTGTSMDEPQNSKSLDTFIGNFIGINKDTLNKAIDYAGSVLGDVYTKGSTGSYLNIACGLPSVRGFFIDQAETDNARFGSPLNAVKTLSTLSGFCVCENATIDVGASRSPLPVEIDGIINLLNRGIYLE